MNLCNATYPSEFTANRTAPLTDGIYSEAAAPGSASTVVVTYVDAVIAEDFAAVVLASSGGGSGTFYTLHLVSSEGRSLSIGAGTQLGDRVLIRAIAIVGSEVRVALTAHADDDPLCRPTLDETRVYGFSERGFGLLATSPGLGAGAPAPAQTGTAGLGTSGQPSPMLIVLAALGALTLVMSARVAVHPTRSRDA